MSPDPEYAWSRLRTKSQEFARAAVRTRAASHSMLDSAWRVHRLAKQLGHTDCVSLLQQNLDEEKATDKKLTQ